MCRNANSLRKQLQFCNEKKFSIMTNDLPQCLCYNIVKSNADGTRGKKTNFIYREVLYYTHT